MIAPDLETAISRLRDLIEGARSDRPVHRGRHLDRMRHPGFPLARRPVDQEPADPVRRLHGERRDARRGLAAALRHGGEFRQGEAGPRASGAGEPLSRRQGAGAGDAEHRQSASGLRHRAGRCRRTARQHHLRDVPRMRRSATNCRGCGRQFEAAGERAPDCACGGYIKTATVSFGQAMPAEAMQRAEQLTRGCDLFLAIGSSLVVWPAAGFPLMAKRNGAAPRHHQSRADRVRRHRRSGGASRHRRRARALHRALIRQAAALCIDLCASTFCPLPR